jgi:hypothetical protein
MPRRVATRKWQGRTETGELHPAIREFLLTGAPPPEDAPAVFAGKSPVGSCCGVRIGAD